MLMRLVTSEESAKSLLNSTGLDMFIDDWGGDLLQVREKPTAGGMRYEVLGTPGVMLKKLIGTNVLQHFCLRGVSPLDIVRQRLDNEVDEAQEH